MVDLQMVRATTTAEKKGSGGRGGDRPTTLSVPGVALHRSARVIKVSWRLWPRPCQDSLQDGWIHIVAPIWQFIQ